MKHARQYEAKYPGTVASLAVDGNTNPSLDGGSCAYSTSHWWFITLGHKYEVYNITLFTRDSDYGKLISNIDFQLFLIFFI